MTKVTASYRLLLCGGLILISAVYAVLVAKDPALASAISSGYVALVVTVFLLVNFWKKT